MVNEHNAWVPRDFWLEDCERAAIVAYFKDYPDEGYRRLTYMMMDAEIVAVCPSSVYRALTRRRASSALERQALAEGHRDSFNHLRRTSTGTWTCHTSTYAGLSITFAAMWTEAAGTS